MFPFLSLSLLRSKLEIRRNRYLNLSIISVRSEFVANFYGVEMFKRAKKYKRKFDVMSSSSP